MCRGLRNGSAISRRERSGSPKIRRVATFAFSLTESFLYFFCFLCPFQDMISHDSLCFPDNCFYVQVRHVCTLVLLRWKIVKTNYCYHFLPSTALWTVANAYQHDKTGDLLMRLSSEGRGEYILSCTHFSSLIRGSGMHKTERNCNIQNISGKFQRNLYFKQRLCLNGSTVSYQLEMLRSVSHFIYSNAD